MANLTEYDAFSALVGRVLTLPHEAIQQRLEEHRKRSPKNPNRPSPKP